MTSLPRNATWSESAVLLSCTYKWQRSCNFQERGNIFSQEKVWTAFMTRVLLLLLTAFASVSLVAQQNNDANVSAIQQQLNELKGIVDAANQKIQQLQQEI